MSMNGHTSDVWYGYLIDAVNKMRAARHADSLHQLRLPVDRDQEDNNDWPSLTVLQIWMGRALQLNDKPNVHYGVSEAQLRYWWQRIQGMYPPQKLAEMLGYDTVDWYMPKAIAGVQDTEGSYRCKPLWLRYRQPEQFKPKKILNDYEYTAEDGSVFLFEVATRYADGRVLVKTPLDKRFEGGNGPGWYQIYEDRQAPITYLQRAARIWLLSQLCHRAIETSTQLFKFEVNGLNKWLIDDVIVPLENYAEDFNDFEQESMSFTGLKVTSWQALLALLKSEELQMRLRGVAGPGHGEPEAPPWD